MKYVYALSDYNDLETLVYKQSVTLYNKCIWIIKGTV